jgi:hypothetical protein
MDHYSRKNTFKMQKNLNPLVTNIAIKIIPLNINLLDYFRVIVASYSTCHTLFFFFQFFFYFYKHV